MAKEELNIAAECTEIYLNFNFQKPDESMNYLLSKLIEIFNARSALIYRIDKDSCNLVAEKYKPKDKNDDSEPVIEELVIPTSKEGVKYAVALEDGTSLKEMQLVIDDIINVFLKKLLGDYEDVLRAKIDVMTNTFNRNEFERVKDEIRKQDPPVNVIVSFIDVFSLKEANDTYGHDAGDRYIKAVAKAIKGYVGSVLGDNASFFRSGGDEFVVLCKAENEESAKTKAELITEKLKDAKNFVEESSDLIIGLPGITSFDHGESFGLSNNLSDVLANADEIMYASKEEHKKLKKAPQQP